MLDNMYSWDKVAACAYICEMTHGYENTQFTDMINCMLDNQCLEQYPEDGPCIGGDEDALQNVKKMEDIEGKLQGVSIKSIFYWDILLSVQNYNLLLKYYDIKSNIVLCYLHKYYCVTDKGVSPK